MHDIEKSWKTAEKGAEGSRAKCRKTGGKQPKKSNQLVFGFCFGCLPAVFGCALIRHLSRWPQRLQVFDLIMCGFLVCLVTWPCTSSPVKLLESVKSVSV